MDRHIDRHEVRRLREAKLWTQEELADKCRLSARTVQRVETAGIGSAHTIRSLAEALEVDPASLAADPEPTDLGQGPLELPWTGVAAAFIWVALASLLYIPTAESGVVTSAVAALGFASFVVGLWCWGRARRQVA